MKTHIVLKKNISPSDVDIVFCFTNKKEKAKSHQKVFDLPQKKDFVIVKPKVSQDVISRIQEAIAEKSFSAKSEETLLLRGCGTQTKHTLVIGLGQVTQPPQQGKEVLPAFEVFRRSGAITFQALDKMKALTAQCDFQHLNLFSGQHIEHIMQAFLEGFYLANYQFEEHFSQEKKSPYVFKSLAVIAQNPSMEATLKQGDVKGHSYHRGGLFCSMVRGSTGQISSHLSL